MASRAAVTSHVVERAAHLTKVLKRAQRASRSELLDARVMSALQFLALLPDVAGVLVGAMEHDRTCCPNCDGASPKLFCCELCSQEAAFIRYLRRKVSNVDVGIDVVRDGIGTPLLMIRGGGYPTRERTVPKATREFVISRDGGLCQVCGAAGTEIDHIAGSSNDPGNLRLLCKTHNGVRVHENAIVVDDPVRVAEIQAHDRRLAERVAAVSPYRLCDDEVRWQSVWSTFRPRKAARVVVAPPPAPPSIPALCEAGDCSSAPRVRNGYSNRCYTCFKALCEGHTIPVRGGPPGHRETDTYCPDCAPGAQECAIAAERSASKPFSANRATSMPSRWSAIPRYVIGAPSS